MNHISYLPSLDTLAAVSDIIVVKFISQGTRCNFQQRVLDVMYIVTQMAHNTILMGQLVDQCYYVMWITVRLVMVHGTVRRFFFFVNYDATYMPGHTQFSLHVRPSWFNTQIMQFCRSVFPIYKLAPWGWWRWWVLAVLWDNVLSKWSLNQGKRDWQNT
jgi:hypothetical protein